MMKGVLVLLPPNDNGFWGNKYVLIIDIDTFVDYPMIIFPNVNKTLIKNKGRCSYS